jgi:Bacterial antitoxin of type II TA system, VapB
VGIYEPLAKHLSMLPHDTWNANFAEIERILSRKLPVSAYDYRPWWGNQKKGNHSQAKAWREAGWETRDVNLERKTVRFQRVRAGSVPGAESVTTGQLDQLWEKAHRVTGIQDRDAVLEAALRALINREAAKYFASIGGTMPDFKPAPRERPFG